MDKSQIPEQVALLEHQILSVKKEAEILKNQIEKTRIRMRDEDLIQTSINVVELPKNNSSLKRYQKLKGHQDKVAAVRWNKDSSHLMSVSQDGFMIIWNSITGLKENAIILDSEWVLTGAYSPNGRLALSAGLNNSCVIYNISKAQLRPPPQRTKNYVSNTYEMISPMTQNPIRTILKGHRGYISDCDFYTDESILTSSGDLTCALWDIEKGTKAREFTQHFGDVLCLSIQRECTGEPLFVSGSADGYVRLWDRRNPVPVQQFQVSQSDVTAVKFFPDNGSFAVGSDDGVVRLFDIRADCQLSQYSLPRNLHLKQYKSQHKLYHTLGSNSPMSKNADYGYGTDSLSLYSDIDNLGVSSLDFSRSGRILFVCYSDMGCLVWDVLKNEVVEELQGHRGRINQVCTNPDGTLVATASWDSTINIWSAP